MGKSAIITQSNYLPWKGYFDNIAMADEFVIYDSVQYTRRDWRNRNKIKTSNGLKWLTVPVQVSGRFHQNIDETRIDGQKWASKHWNSILHSYGKSAGFEVVETLFAELYANMSFVLLSELNTYLIEKILGFLDISTTVTSSSDYELSGDKNKKLINICESIGVTRYLTGPAAKGYLDESLFNKHGIEIHYFNNVYHREYDQPFPPFQHQVSIVDLIASCGDRAKSYMKNVPS